MSETPPNKETVPSAEGAPPAGDAKPAEGAKPGAEAKPAGDTKPAEGTPPAADAKPAEGTKPVAEAKPAGDAKPAPKVVPKPAAKPKVEKKPLIDNQDGTITDPNSGLMWKQTDAWLDMHKFYTWQEQPEYVEKFNKEKFAGHSDWRIPNKADCMTLVEKGRKETVMDKNGTLFPFDPVFTEGCVSNTWISECTEEEVIRFDFKIGSDFKYPPSELWASIRLVRDVAPKKEEVPAEEAKEEAKKEEAKPAEAKSEEPAPAA
jgi:hypothetical protein